ncbi:MAG: GFA family protein [Gammaproteobacteria bacterium]|nr:GFA family protein [Gammaproteobacteria bacterium]
MKVTGACHCGQISFEAEVNPGQVLICHCTDCQTLSGSACRTATPVTEDGFKLLRGNLKTYKKIAEDGTPRAQTFCPECGTPIFVGPADGDTGMLGIRVGSISQRDRLPPNNQHYCGSAQAWVQDLSAVIQIEN